MENKNSDGLIKMIMVGIFSAAVGGLISGIGVYYYTTADNFNISDIANRIANGESVVAAFSNPVITTPSNDRVFSMYREFPTIPSFGAISGYSPDMIRSVRDVEYFSFIFSYDYFILEENIKYIEDYINLLLDNNFEHPITHIDGLRVYQIYKNTNAEYSVAIRFNLVDSFDAVNPLTGERRVHFIVYIIETDQLNRERISNNIDSVTSPIPPNDMRYATDEVPHGVTPPVPPDNRPNFAAAPPPP